MGAFSSDEELDLADVDDSLKRDPKVIKQKIRKLTNVKSQGIEKVHLKKRVKKIMKKIRHEALECDGFNKRGQNLASLHQLVVEQRVSID